MKEVEAHISTSGPSRREFLWKAGATVSLLAELGPGTFAEAAAKDARDLEKPKAEKKVGKDSSPELLTFDRVQQSGHEVNYGEVSSLYGGPMSKHPVVSVKAHPEVIWVRPDMGIGMVATPFAFGVGDSPRQVRWREVRRSLQEGCLPIVTSHWQDGSLRYEQLAFATLLGASQVKTGREKQVAMVQMGVTNTDPSEGLHAVLWAFVPGAVAAKGVPPPPYNTYDFFEVVGSLPAVPSEPTMLMDDVLRSGAVVMGIHSEDPGVRTTQHGKVLKFEMDLRPGEKKSVYLKVSSNAQGLSATEIQKLRKVDFLSARDRCAWKLRRILSQGTQIRVPEDVVNNIYKAQILYNQPQMVQAADRDYYMPVQGYIGVWPWEAMKMLVPLDAMGYHEDVTKSLVYFLKLQDKQPPNGKIDNYKGYFSGTGTFEDSGWENDPHSTIYGMYAAQEKGKWFPGWMNWTGAVLYAFGEHYFYSNDVEGLRRAAPALVRACNWIINVRKQTKQKDGKGHKVLQYGLMPAGEPYDLSEKQAKQSSYYFCFTDGYTCQGLKRIAQALADIGHPEGQRLLGEAKEYHEDILEVMRRTRQANPDLPPYPDHLYSPPTPGWADFASGALALVDTGLINPHDSTFVQLENYMKKHYNRNVVGLTGWLRKDGDPNSPNAYYVDLSEDIWQRGWVLRGEVDKALLTFYSTLAYGVDKETLGPVERFDLYDQRYAPFYMDSSGGSRVLGMIRLALLLEEGAVLYLLGGAPRRWLEAGKKIEVERGTTYFGELNLSVESKVDKGSIHVTLDLEKRHPERLKEIRLRIPHPDKQKIKQVTVNGAEWKDLDQEREVIILTPTTTRYQIVAHY